MNFPVEFNLLGHRVPAHGVMELLAYMVGVQFYFWLRRRGRLGAGAALPVDQNLWLIVGCVLGAMVGSKVLAWAESPLDYWARRSTPLVLLGGKTIVGGLLGGWVGVELVKKRLGVKRATGDLFVFPLVVGIAIGRVGCFLTGLADHTHGMHTSLPWGVNFGDGPRHPTQLYEIAFLVVLGCVLFWRSRGEFWNGELFQWFMAGYLGFRLVIEFIKPRYVLIGGLSAIQLACVLGLLECVRRLARRPVKIDARPAMMIGE
ncbi:MAG TPA: prolipoprotein diacylglyceryl transferase family protein [Tepidisphaeraceae bacterium]|nr:prolipoprotein diacylglyceryl transferase family protein [Tepidisphaeraceae bacterium]